MQLYSPNRAQVSQATDSRGVYRLYPLLSMTIASELAHIPPPKRPIIIPGAEHFLCPIGFLFADKKETDRRKMDSSDFFTKSHTRRRIQFIVEIGI